MKNNNYLVDVVGCEGHVVHVHMGGSRIESNEKKYTWWLAMN